MNSSGNLSNLDSGSVGISATESFHNDGTAVLSVQFDRKSSFLAHDHKTSTPGRTVSKPMSLDMSMTTYASLKPSEAPSAISTIISRNVVTHQAHLRCWTRLKDHLQRCPHLALNIRVLKQTCPVDPSTIPEIRVEAEPETLYPEDIRVPIQGYEVMEERAKFTVYKIQVEKSDHESWFVFRRYTDFSHLNEKLLSMFPGIRLSLPPKRWFRSNYEREFLDDRLQGLQAFLNNVTGHSDICNSKPVREFFCFDDPPGPHDSLEESRALCENLEETTYHLRQVLDDRDREILLLREELDLYKSQVAMLSKRLREVSGVRDTSALMSPISNEFSVAECDMEVSLEPEADQSHPLPSSDSRLEDGNRETSTPIPDKDHPAVGKSPQTSHVVPVMVHSEAEDNT
ncbi:sorting nexin-16-like [Haliotis rubra]|uniref:sorting nexin-16-like n=1 Tax=Haliotis rubra TaxID=36100 RepID=UPI001EE5A633|nr:sorting nexin-16-like [Haliotis rubra]